jgi:hypothetical protein
MDYNIIQQEKKEQKQELQKKKTVKAMLEGHHVYCYPANGKAGYPGWNNNNLEEFLRTGNEILEKYPSSNLAVNLELSNLICIDIDDPEKFAKIYDVGKFNTLLCKTPKGYHIFLRNDIGLDKNINIKGVEILCKNHLANIYGENYQLTFREAQNASEYKNFFDIILNLSNSQSQNKDNSLSEYLHTEVINRVLHTEVYQEKKFSPNRLLYVYTPYDRFLYAKTLSEIFKFLEELEKDFEFIRSALNLFVGVEAEKGMLCILHEEKHESAGFYRNKSGRWFYKDFHDGKVYSILDLLLEVLKIPDSMKKLFKQAFAYYLVRVYLSNQSEKEIEIVKLLRSKSEKLANVYLLIASLNSSPEEHFLSVRSLAGILQLKDITKANRLLNYLCLIGVLEKNKRGYGKAYGYKVRDINIHELEKELERTREIDIYRLSKENALKYFDEEKIEKIYLRASDKKEQKAKKKELVGVGV